MWHSTLTLNYEIWQYFIRISRSFNAILLKKTLAHFKNIFLQKKMVLMPGQVQANRQTVIL